MAWWIWAVAAVLVGLAELQAPGSYLMWIGLGAGVTALVEAILTLSLTGQIEVFIVASAVSCLAGYFVYRRMHDAGENRDQLNERELSMVGAQGVVCPGFANGVGKVQLGDSVWLAEGTGLSEGDAVVVKAVRGTRLLVEPAGR